MFRTVKFRFRKLFVSDRNRISHPRRKLVSFFETYGGILNKGHKEHQANAHVYRLLSTMRFLIHIRFFVVRDTNYYLVYLLRS